MDCGVAGFLEIWSTALHEAHEAGTISKFLALELKTIFLGVLYIRFQAKYI